MGFGLGLKLGLGKGGGRPVNIQFLHNGFTAPDTLTTGALYVADNLGILRTAGVDKLAIPGARLSGSDFVLTDTEGAQLFTSASVRTKSQGGVTQYNDADWQGMLVMPARTNLVWPSTPNAANWVASGVTLTENAGTAPDGTNTASRAQGTTGGKLLYRGGLGVIGTQYTVRRWVKSNTGSAQTFQLFGNQGGTFSGDLTATTDWQYFSFTFTQSVGSGTDQVGIADNVAGSTYDLLIWHGNHEAGSFGTPIIPTTTTTVTRAATVPSFTSANQLRANDMGGRVHVLPSAAGQTGWLFNSYTGAAAEFGLLANPTTLVLRNRNASVDTDLTLNYTHVADREFEVDWLKLATGMHARVREKIAGTWQAWSDWEDLTSAGAQADATIAATYQYARNGANQFAASRPNFYTMFNATKAKLEAL